MAQHRHAKHGGPKPETSGGMPDLNSGSEGVGGGCIALLAYFAYVGLLFWLLPRSVDMAVRPAWIATHFSEYRSLPEDRGYCSEPFCMRTDTEQKYLAGRPGDKSEITMPYCADHEPVFYLRSQTRLDVFTRALFGLLCFVLAFPLVVGATILALWALAWPLTLFSVIFGGEEPVALLPPAMNADSMWGVWVMVGGWYVGIGLWLILGIADLAL